jgi:hypothetical protein
LNARRGKPCGWQPRPEWSWLGAVLWRAGGWRRGLAAAGLATAAFGLTLAPWVAKVHQVYGGYALSAEAGRALFAANHPLVFTNFPDGSIDRDRDLIFSNLTARQVEMVNRLQANTLEMDRWFMGEGLAEIRADPAGLIKRALRKLWVAFRPLPSPRHSLLVDLPFALVWTALLLLGLAGMWSRRADWRKHLPIHAHFALFCGSTALIWAHTAHRSYLDVYLMVFAGAFLVERYTAWRAKPALG